MSMSSFDCPQHLQNRSQQAVMRPPPQSCQWGSTWIALVFRCIMHLTLTFKIVTLMKSKLRHSTHTQQKTVTNRAELLNASIPLCFNYLWIPCNLLFLKRIKRVIYSLSSTEPATWIALRNNIRPLPSFYSFLNKAIMQILNGTYCQRILQCQN